MSRLLIVVLLLGSTQLGANSSVRGGMSNKGLVGKTKQMLVTALLGTALAISVPQVTTAQENGDAVFQTVTADDPAYRRSAVLLRVSNPEEGTELGFHFAHVGVDESGNSILIGRDRADGVDVANFLDNSTISLYGWDGRIADDVTARIVDTFEDRVDGVFNMVALSLDGMDMTDNYPSAVVENTFPYEEVEDMELLTYRLFYSPHLTAEEVASGNFLLRWRACESSPHPKVAQVKAGFTTCGNPNGLVAVGSLLFRDGRLVAILSRPAGRIDKKLWILSTVSEAKRPRSPCLARPPQLGGT